MYQIYLKNLIIKHSRLLFSIFLIVSVVLFQGGGIYAISSDALNSIINGRPFYMPQQCSTSSSTGNTSVSNLNLTYTDSSRGNRSVGVDVYIPQGGSGPYPLLMFAPGQARSGAPDSIYSRYLQAISSQGFVVAAPNFPNNDGNHKPDEVQDMKFVITQLLTESKLQGDINGDEIGAFGHSDGGVVIYDLYGTDSRIKAYIEMSSGSAPGGAGPPILNVAGVSDGFHDYNPSINNNATYSAFIGFKGANHINYIMGKAVGDNAAPPGLDGSAIAPILDNITGAFFKRFLLGDGSDATDLSKIVSQHTDTLTAFAQGGTPTPAGNADANSSGSPNSSSQDLGSTCCDGGSGSGLGGSLDTFLQAIALHESGGNPAANSGNGAYGKYQFIPSTWQGYSREYYPPGQQYATANLAPENVQDTVAYLANIHTYNQFKGDPFWMAINWYQPSATSAYPNKDASSLDVAPPGNGGLTYKKYGSDIAQAVSSGTLEGRGPISSIKLSYTSAPDFQTWLAKDGGAPSGGGSISTGGSGCGSGGVANGSFVFYAQCDNKWKSHPYGDGTVCSSGCGPTSVAMVVATLADSSVTPPQAADYSMQSGGWVSGSGTSWGFLASGPEHWGLHSQQLGIDMDKAVSVLKGGGLVIAAGTGTLPFTSVGHIIVLKGIASNGDILVGDPGQDKPTTQYSVNTIASSGLLNLVGVTK